MDETGVTLHEIGQIALTVNDLEEAKAFYRDVLGMRHLFDAGAMTFFQCGAIRLLIGTAEPKDARRKPWGTVLYFRVDDLAATCAQLKSRGVAFAQEPHLVARMKDHDLWMAFFQDPAGNSLSLMSELQLRD